MTLIELSNVSKRYKLAGDNVVNAVEKRRGFAKAIENLGFMSPSLFD
jgi:hypothetical protein